MCDETRRPPTLSDLEHKQGSGLKPELKALLMKSAFIGSRGAIPLPVQPVAIIPRHQFATKAELDAAGIPILTGFNREAG
ncbi:MAG: hypothetical protein N4A61_03600 [Pelagimonas sp.]|jgi:hypothetical protein|nr:hypothetical protein [Pelagimonas sp.]